MPRAKKAEAVKVETVKTYTLEEAQKILNDRKTEAKNARKGRKDRAGFHRDDQKDNDAEYNVLARGEQSDGKGRLMECRALMAAGGKVRVTVYPCGAYFKGVSAVGNTVEEATAGVAELLIVAAEGVNATGKDSMAATLARDYAKLAKGHKFNPPKRDSK
jgi:hypothetical protein